MREGWPFQSSPSNRTCNDSTPKAVSRLRLARWLPGAAAGPVLTKWGRAGNMGRLIINPARHGWPRCRRAKPEDGHAVLAIAMIASINRGVS